MKWTKKEIEILKRYYPTTPKDNLIAIFKKINRNRTWLSIFKKANRLGLKKITHREVVNEILREKYAKTPLETLIKEIQKYIPI